MSHTAAYRPNRIFISGIGHEFLAVKAGYAPASAANEEIGIGETNWIVRSAITFLRPLHCQPASSRHHDHIVPICPFGRICYTTTVPATSPPTARSNHIRGYVTISQAFFSLWLHSLHSSNQNMNSYGSLKHNWNNQADDNHTDMKQHTRTEVPHTLLLRRMRIRFGFLAILPMHIQLFTVMNQRNRITPSGNKNSKQEWAIKGGTSS